ncbi:syntaxin-2-like isoform 2-T3 [Menidia menidia]
MTDTTEGTVNLEDFFKTVEHVSSIIERISCQAEEVEKRQGMILSSSNISTSNKDDLELLDNETKKNAKFVRAKLKYLFHIFAAMQKSCSVEYNSSSTSVIHRIQRNQHSHLTRWFAEVMRGYHKAQISFREKCKAQIQRQLVIVDKEVTDEELEEMLRCDNLAIFISEVNSDTHISSQALTEIERRHQDIVGLESSIKELHEIFADTAMLLEIQGELINNIERNVMSAAEYVGASRQETHKAVAYKKNRHKIASLPSFFKPFKRQSSLKAETEVPSDLNHG